MIEMLIEHGSPIAGTAALHIAARYGELGVMRLLLRHGADVNEVLDGWNDWTPMHLAASKRQIEAMKLLEEYGALSDFKDKNGKTAAQLLDESKAGGN
jgi:ankyrin repeat protein